LKRIGGAVVFIDSLVSNNPQVSIPVFQKIPYDVVADGSSEKRIGLVHFNGTSVIPVESIPGAQPNVIVPVHVHGGDGAVG
jgi:hypothetical protein